jgi:thioredoxin-related protein
VTAVITDASQHCARPAARLYPVAVWAVLLIFSGAAAGCGARGDSSVTVPMTGNYAAAVAQAKAENKKILLDFTGSDWCEYCQQLDQNVFSTAEFANYAKEHYVCVTVDFPREKTLPSDVVRQNAALQQKYGVDGFPTVILLDAHEIKLDEMVGYDGVPPKVYLAALDQDYVKNPSPAPKPPVANAAPPAPVASAPTPAPATPPAEATPPAPPGPSVDTQAFVDKVTISGLRLDGATRRIIIQGQVYNVGDMVNPDFKLKLAAVELHDITFVDAGGFLYHKRI